MLAQTVFQRRINQPLIMPRSILCPAVFPLQRPRPGFVEGLPHARAQPELRVGVLAAAGDRPAQ